MICEIINDYTDIYKYQSYGIDVCEKKQKLKTLEYIKNKLSATTCTDIGCVSCGATTEQGTYSCSPIIITAIGPNNLMAMLDNYSYCYDNINDTFNFRFDFTVTYTNPSTIVLSFLDIYLDFFIQPITDEYYSHPFGTTYRLYGTIPNAGLDLYARIRVSDGTSNIDFAIEDVLESDAIKYPCLIGI